MFAANGDVASAAPAAPACRRRRRESSEGREGSRAFMGSLLAEVFLLGIRRGLGHHLSRVARLRGVAVLPTRLHVGAEPAAALHDGLAGGYALRGIGLQRLRRGPV